MAARLTAHSQMNRHFESNRIRCTARSTHPDLVLSKGSDVHGIIRRSSSFNTSRLNDLYVDLHERKSFNCASDVLS